ncbi:MAG: retropepsin-like domain-containing protein, partial [Candidatus Thiodiazotropha taylori]|nr:retropepsin-like domain-containing protein [Candidatus Thiodiazotropha taylori]MCW4284618.1 retropepsin-like domain-containing protein [Candidatus Thiodiazotropha taylori]
RDVKKLFCKVCGSSHGAWNCVTFRNLSLPLRWDTAKELQLCFRCLGDNHFGRSCPRSGQCGQNGCKELHHKLLHKSDSTELKRSSSEETNRKNTGKSLGTASLPEQPVSSATEGKASIEQMTMLTQNQFRGNYVGLRTVPVIVRNGDIVLTVNALLDDASTKTYINADVAAELGLKGKTEQVTVNVLNGQVETFETRPVEFELQSVNDNVRMKVSAFTANRVTGTMTVVDWYKYKKQWPHLKSIDFQRCASKPIVDILIGQDCASLHYALEEVRGKPGEPVARLTPLGWTCIGNPRPSDRPVLQTNFACTFFVKNVSEIEMLNETKKFWEIESVST